MTNLELAYIAGLIDGEGCIRVFRHARKRAKGWVEYGVNVRIEMTRARKIFVSLRQEFGGSINFRKRSLGNLPQYLWNLGGRKARIFLQSILPFLHIKRSEANLAIRFQTLVESKRSHEVRNSRKYEYFYRQLRKGKFRKAF